MPEIGDREGAHDAAFKQARPCEAIDWRIGKEVLDLHEFPAKADKHRHGFVGEVSADRTGKRETDDEGPAINGRGDEHVVVAQLAVIDRADAGLPIARFRRDQPQDLGDGFCVTASDGEPRH